MRGGDDGQRDRKVVWGYSIAKWEDETSTETLHPSFLGGRSEL